MNITPEQSSEIAQLQPPWWFRYVPAKIKIRLQDRIHLLTASDTLGWLLIDTIITTGISFVLSFLLARALGPTQFGYYTYILAFFSLFLPISRLGIANVLIKNLAQKKNPSEHTLGTAFGLRLLASLVTLSAAVVGMILLRPNDLTSQTLVAFLGLMTTFQTFEVIEYFYQSQLAVQKLTLAKITAVIISAGLKITALLNGASVSTFIFLLLMEAILIAIAYSILYAREHSFLNWKIKKNIAKPLMRQSIPLVLSSMVIMGYGQADQLFLHFYRGPEQLAQYAVALTILNGLSLLPVIIHRAIAPIIMKINLTTHLKLFHHQLLQIYRAITIVSVLVGAGMILLGPWMIGFLYGEVYQEAGYIVALLPFRFFFVSFGVMRALFVVSQDLFDFDLLTNFAGLIVSVVGSILLIPPFGVYGLLMASFCSLLTSTFLLDVFHPKLRKNVQLAVHAMITPHKVTFGNSS